MYETLSHLTHLPHPALWCASQRLDGALEARLFDWRKYLQHARREKRRVSAAHTKARVWRGQWEEIQGLFATDRYRYRMKGWKTLEKTRRRRRRMWESDFIQHFGKSSIFTGITTRFSRHSAGGLYFFLHILVCHVKKNKKKTLDFCKWFSCWTPTRLTPKLTSLLPNVFSWLNVVIPKWKEQFHTFF